MSQQISHSLFDTGTNKNGYKNLYTLRIKHGESIFNMIMKSDGQ